MRRAAVLGVLVLLAAACVSPHPAGRLAQLSIVADESIRYIGEMWQQGHVSDAVLREAQRAVRVFNAALQGAWDAMKAGDDLKFDDYLAAARAAIAELEQIAREIEKRASPSGRTA